MIVREVNRLLTDAIVDAIAYSETAQALNPYGDGKVGTRIANTLWLDKTG